MPDDHPHVLAHVFAHVLTRSLAGARMARDNKPLRCYAEVGREREGHGAGGSPFVAGCSACHSIGGGAGKLDPDLAGAVERRPRAWLQRWIEQIDRMRAEKDPAAMALVANNRGVARRNLKLSDANVAELIEYLG